MALMLEKAKMESVFPLFITQSRNSIARFLLRQKILVQNQKNQVGVQVQITLDDGVDILALGQQFDVLGARKSARCSKNRSRWDSPARRNFSRPDDFHPNTLSQLTSSGCL